ncbi:hypothetical protein BKA69DRAFT_823951 [Paraphysoderma sedebokerense]|nr:hypothetical protein BKA69DRAFT_823951 [Paraphysoderma sedebokerense]
MVAKQRAARDIQGTPRGGLCGGAFTNKLTIIASSHQLSTLQRSLTLPLIIYILYRVLLMMSGVINIRYLICWAATRVDSVGCVYVLEGTGEVGVEIIRFIKRVETRIRCYNLYIYSSALVNILRSLSLKPMYAGKVQSVLDLVSHFPHCDALTGDGLWTVEVWRERSGNAHQNSSELSFGEGKSGAGPEGRLEYSWNVECITPELHFKKMDVY